MALKAKDELDHATILVNIARDITNLDQTSVAANQ